MKSIGIAVLLAAVSSMYGAPLQPRLQQKLDTVRPKAAARQSLVEDAVFAFYVKQFQQDAEV